MLLFPLTLARGAPDLVAASIYAAVRRWWGRHAFTTSIVSGVLVLLVTVLIVNRVLSVRQLRDRSRAIAAQAAIVMSQAARATRAVVAVLKGGDRDTASDELRTYMTMLLISAPVLIDASLSRTFLEEAQTLGAELARALAATRDSEPTDELRAHLDAAVDRMRAVSQPLLDILKPEERLVVTAEDTGTDAQDTATDAQATGTDTEDPTKTPQTIGRRRLRNDGTDLGRWCRSVFCGGEVRGAARGGLLAVVAVGGMSAFWAGRPAVSGCVGSWRALRADLTRPLGVTLC
jgi:hypothetical protein